MPDDRPRHHLRGYADLPPPRPRIADPAMPHGAYRRQPGYRPPRPARPLLDDNARTSAWVAAVVVGLVVLLVALIAVPVLVCPLLVATVVGVGVWAYVHGWRPRQRLL